jgi:hypothetical protein
MLNLSIINLFAQKHLFNVPQYIPNSTLDTESTKLNKAHKALFSWSIYTSEE